MGRGGRETLGGGYLLWALTATGCGENRQTACCPQQLGGGLRGHLKVQAPRVQGWAGSWGLLQEPTDEQRAFTVSQPRELSQPRGTGRGGLARLWKLLETVAGARDGTRGRSHLGTLITCVPTCMSRKEPLPPRLRSPTPLSPAPLPRPL